MRFERTLTLAFAMVLLATGLAAPLTGTASAQGGIGPAAFKLVWAKLRDPATQATDQVFIDPSRPLVLDARVDNFGDAVVDKNICFRVQDDTQDLPPHAGGISAQWSVSMDVTISMGAISSTSHTAIASIPIPARTIPLSSYAPAIRELNVTINPSGGAAGCSSSDYPEAPTANTIPPSDPRDDNTVALKYVVNRFPDFALRNVSAAIDKPIAWCTTSARDSTQDNQGRYTNLSAYPACTNVEGVDDHVAYGSSFSFFWANVVNQGDWRARNGGAGNHSFEDPRNPGKTLPYVARFELLNPDGSRDQRFDYDADPVVGLNKDPFGYVSTFTDTRFDLTRRAGDFFVRVTLNPIDAPRSYLERKGTTGADLTGNEPNTWTERFHIRSPDLTGFFGSYAGDDPLTHPAPPGEYVTIPFLIKNVGDYRANRTAEDPDIKISWTLELDPGEATYQVWDSSNIPGGDVEGLEVNQSVLRTVQLYVRNAGPEATQIRPGFHTLRLTVDSATRADARAGSHTESNETNNVVTAIFYVRDNTPPALLSPGNTYWFVSHDRVSDGKYYVTRGRNWAFHFNVTDDSFNFRSCMDCVWTTWSLAGTGGASPIRIDAKPNEETSSTTGRLKYPFGWYVENPDGSLLPVGTYDVTLHARDPTGNNATARTLGSLVVVQGFVPKVKADAPDTDPGAPGNFTFEFTSSERSTHVDFVFNVTDAGYATTRPIALDKVNISLEGPDGPVYPPLTSKHVCHIGGIEGSCTLDYSNMDPTTAGRVGTSYEFDATRISEVKRYLLNVTVRDAGNDTHVFPFRIVYRHEAPVFEALAVPENVTAGESLQLSTGFSSTFAITRVTANVTDPKGVTRSFPLSKLQGETTWSTFLATGMDSVHNPRDLPRHGTYRISLVAEDEYGGVNATAPKNVRVVDVVSPVIVESTSGPRFTTIEDGKVLVEQSRAVEFVAEVLDQTPLNVSLVLYKDSVKIGEVEMAHKTNATYNVSVPFPVAGEYSYAFKARDSAGLETLRTGHITVIANLPPRLELSPGVPPLGQGTVRYIRPSTPLELTIRDDNNGVDVNRLQVWVNDVVDNGFKSSIKPSNCGTVVCNTVTLTAVLGSRVHDNDTVRIAVHVADRAGAWSNDTVFHLKVDTTAPRPFLLTPLNNASPADGRGDAVNVTPATRLVFLGTDETGYVNSLVREIRVEVRAEAGGPVFKFPPWRAEATPGWQSRTTPVSFTKEFLDDAFLIPGRYVVTAYAVDQAGNEGNARYVVNLLKEGPRVRFNSTDADAARGFVNATVLDVSRTGVKDVRVHFQGGSGEWRNATLVKDSRDIWRGRIDAYPKGTVVRYYVAAVDTLGLPGQTPTTRNFTAPNHAPLILDFQHNQLPNPEVRSNLKLNWTISDVDGDTYTVTLQAVPSLRGMSPVPISLTTDGMVLVNTPVVLDDGSWTFVLRAVDAEGAAEERALAVWVNNNPVAVLNPQLDRSSLRPGETLVVTATIQKLSSEVLLEYKLQGTSEWRSVPMTPETGSLYRAELPVPVAGKYDLRIIAKYLGPDGKPLEEKYPLPALTVESNAVDSLGGNAVLWAGILLLTVLAIGGGGYALRRWR